MGRVLGHTIFYSFPRVGGMVSIVEYICKGRGYGVMWWVSCLGLNNLKFIHIVFVLIAAIDCSRFPDQF